MKSFPDSLDLRSSGRTIEVPFHTQINCNGRFSDLVCTRLLRVLPGKRIVCLGEWEGRQIVAKFFFGPRATRHCNREERGLKALKKAGIKTPALLFKGMITQGSTPVLGIQRLVEAQDLAQTWEKLTDDGQRTILLERAVAFIAGQHEAGLKQNDLHLGNFLLAGDSIYAIDGDTVDTRVTGKPLAQKKSLQNISKFFAQFHPQFDQQASKVFQKYVKIRAWQQRERLSLQLIKQIRTHRNHRKKDYLKKIYRECSAFVCKKTWHQFIVCDRRFHTEEITGFWADPDSLVDSGKILKKGKSSTVSLVELDGHHFAVKRYNIKSLWHGLKRCVRPSRAWVSWRNAHRMFFILGIPTPEPIMLMEKRWGPFRSTAYFVTEYIEGMDISHLLRKDDAKNYDQETLINQVGKLLRLLADASISHGDFKATNFTYSSEKLYIIDLDAMREHRFRWCFRRAFRRDLKRLLKNWTDLPSIGSLFREQIDKIRL